MTAFAPQRLAPPIELVRLRSGQRYVGGINAIPKLFGESDALCRRKLAEVE